MINSLLAIDRVAFTLFNRPIYWYGIVITFGIILAFCLYLLLAYKRKIDFDFSLELFIWVIPMAVAFCRIFYVVPRIGDEFSLSSWDGFVNAIDISGGGLTIIGGIFGGAFGVFFCCLRNRKYSLMRVADCVVIAVLLGQIIGRWGNFFNQELYGIEVTNPSLQHLPFAVFIEYTGKWHYASFFFEGTLNAIGLAIALVMYFVPKKPLKNGTFSIFYLGWYGLVRGSLEFIKGGNPVTFGNSNVKVVQVICYIVFVVCVVLQVLLQYGKINFETKWFERMCDKKRQLTCEKVRENKLLSAKDDASQNQEQTSELITLEEVKYNKNTNDGDEK
ncbi:MAG: prolipoprotein diacylglyceryl transferase [Clostridia bacterium]|nr:prolipoprotein diacylglyceryl transferase [Clostridia bacterium]